MSECFWCNSCERPYNGSDEDARAITVQVPRIESGVKVGVYGVERHQCGTCTRNQNRVAEHRRRELEASEARNAPTEVPE